MEGGTLNGTKDLTHNTSVARLDWHEIGKPEFDQVGLSHNMHIT